MNEAVVVNRFTITESKSGNGSIDVVVSHSRVGGGRSVTKTYSPSVEDHKKVIALRDKIVDEMATDLVEAERLPADKLSLVVYAALLEINDKGRLPNSNEKIGLLKRALIQGNLDNPAHVAKSIVTALDNDKGFAARVTSQPRGGVGITD